MRATHTFESGYPPDVGGRPPIVDPNQSHPMK